MAAYGVPFFIACRAIDAATGKPKTGDLANVTLTLNRDGVDISFSGTPVERANGLIGVMLTATEAQGTNFTLTGVSTTSGVVLRDGNLSTSSDPAILFAGTARSGNANSIQFALGTTGFNDQWKGCSVELISGTGAGQSRLITAYTSSGTTGSVDRDWTTAPDNTTGYIMRVGQFPAVDGAGLVTTANPAAVIPPVQQPDEIVVSQS